jgi:RNA polymerase sigma-B factor
MALSKIEIQAQSGAATPAHGQPFDARSPAARHREVRRLLAEYAAHRDEAARERLVHLNADLVHFIARRFANRGEPLEDLEQVGFLGLIQAIERFDPGRQSGFSSFAAPTIMGEIRRHFRDRSWAVRVPRRLRENYCRTMRAEEQLTQELGRHPSVAEIGERIGLAPDDVLAALEVSPARHTVSLDSQPRGRGDEEGAELGDRIGQEDGNLERVETRALIEQAMERLSVREREIMGLRFFEQLPQVEVARRLGISQMHVSRIQRAAIEHMRRNLAAMAEDGGVQVVGGCVPVAGPRHAEEPAAQPSPSEGRARPALRWLPVDALRPRADQPRQTIDAGSLAELAESIRQWGILQPLRVRRRTDERYEIIAGERRWSAARQLGMAEVPALVVETDAEGAFIESLTENIQREDLNPVERARALQRLRLSLGSQSWDEVGRVVGITRRHVHHLLNVTRLPADIQGDVRVGELTEKHARALLLLRRSPSAQRALWQRIVDESVSGEAALELARALRDCTGETPHPVVRVRAALRTLTEFLATAGAQHVSMLTAELAALQTRLDAALSGDGARAGNVSACPDPARAVTTARRVSGQWAHRAPLRRDHGFALRRRG